MCNVRNIFVTDVTFTCIIMLNLVLERLLHRTSRTSLEFVILTFYINIDQRTFKVDIMWAVCYLQRAADCTRGSLETKWMPKPYMYMYTYVYIHVWRRMLHTPQPVADLQNSGFIQVYAK